MRANGQFNYIENIVVTFLDRGKIWPEVKKAMETFEKNKKRRIDSFFPRSSKFRKSKAEEPEVVGTHPRLIGRGQPKLGVEDPGVEVPEQPPFPRFHLPLPAL